MTRLEALRTKKALILALAAAHGARNVRVFGSIARGTDDDESDIDLLIDLDSGRSLLDLGALHEDLAGLLGSKVDVITENGLRERVRSRVLREATPL
jgi:predicted nucleotidyltransferase